MFTHTKKKKAGTEYSQLGESDYYFTRKMKHFATAWCNAERQQESGMHAKFFKLLINFIEKDWLCRRSGKNVQSKIK